VDLGLVGILLVAPLFFGGRDDLGRLVYVLLAIATALAWLLGAARQPACRWRHPWTCCLAATAVLLVTAQLVPLPGPWCQRLSPRIVELLPTWQTSSDPVAFDQTSAGKSATLGAWQTLSLAPGRTRIALAMAMAYLLIFVTAVQRLRSVSDIQRMLQGIGLSATWLSLFGLMQYFTSNGRYFWFYEVAGRSTAQSPVGPFFNRNHFAHVLALGIAPLFGWLVFSGPPIERTSTATGGFRRQPSSTTSAKQWGLGLAIAVVGFALLLSMSRGGILAALCAMGTLGGLLWLKGMLGSRHMLAIGGLAALVVGLLSMHGYQNVVSRLDDLTSGSLDQMDQSAWRRKIWGANLAAIRDGWLTGSGAGSHADIYRAYFPESADVEFTHAESSVLQIATENGLPGMLLLIVAIGLASYWCVGSLRRATSRTERCTAATIASGLLASIAHACVDFVWYIPACMVLSLLLLACAVRMHQLTAATEASPADLTWWGWHGLATAVVGMAVVGIGTLWGPAQAARHWNSYRLTLKALAVEQGQQWRTPGGVERAAAQAQLDFFETTMLSQLQEVVRYNPQHARAHVRLAQLYLQRFNELQQQSDNAMSAESVRDAAMASGFDSPRALRDWLRQALGSNAQLLYRSHHHARRALALGPLQGEAYLVLAQVCHLEGWSEQDVDVLLAQARQLRPHDGNVLFEIGRRQLTQGRTEEAFTTWATAYKATGVHQRQIISLLAAHWPATEFLQRFQPDWSTFRDVWLRYRDYGRPEDLQQIVAYGFAQAEREATPTLDDAIHIWLRLAEMATELDDAAQTLRAAQRAYEAAPSQPGVRLALAKALIKTDDPQAAVPHLRWYLARRPGDRVAEQALLACAKAGNTPSSRIQ
jgi:O-antigen ligase/tetratricopeptide (TPR) repeat protein